MRCDLKRFDGAIEDYNRVLDLMASDGVKCVDIDLNWSRMCGYRACVDGWRVWLHVFVCVDGLMATDGTDSLSPPTHTHTHPHSPKTGIANYFEYPDTFVQRGLAYEGLGDWAQSVKDYSRAIELWGGGRGPDINPFVLSYRGNSLARLGRYEESLRDYAASADLFLATRDEADALYARANQALSLYETGKKEEAVKVRERKEERVWLRGSPLVARANGS